MTVFRSHAGLGNNFLDSARQAFGFPFNTGEIYYKVYSWGTLIEVLSGPHAGKYDTWKEDGVWVFIPA